MCLRLVLVTAFLLTSRVAASGESSLGLGVSSLSAYADSFAVNEYKAPVDKGVLVNCIAIGGPCDKKVTPMSIVVKVDKTTIESEEDFHQAVSELKPGNSIQIGVYHAVIVKSTGKPKWSKASFKVTPKSVADVFTPSVNAIKDTVNRATYFHPAHAPESKRSKFFSAYIVVPDDGGPYLKCRVSWYGKDWLFFRKLQIRTDKDTIECDFSIDEHHSDNDGHGVWEWASKRLTPEQVDQFIDIGKSTTVTVRLSGKDYQDEWRLSEIEHRETFAVLSLYQELASLSNDVVALKELDKESK